MSGDRKWRDGRPSGVSRLVFEHFVPVREIAVQTQFLAEGLVPLLKGGTHLGGTVAS